VTRFYTCMGTSCAGDGSDAHMQRLHAIQYLRRLMIGTAPTAGRTSAISAQPDLGVGCGLYDRQPGCPDRKLPGGRR
jgi:hypothetical protein